MPEVLRTWTREMVLALPDDGNRYELFGGELLVSPSPIPSHQLLVLGLYDAIASFVARERLGRAMMSPADIALDGKQLAQPDLFVVPGMLGPAPLTWEEVPRPVLVVEVLSPSTARYDRQVKRRWFQRSGIAEYWIVDPDARQVERWRPEDTRPEVIDEVLVWAPGGPAEPLRIDLPALFSGALGLP